MATRVVEMRAQKERRQKIILVVGGIVFLALAVIQGPKVWDQLNGSTPPPAAAPPTETTPAPAAPTAGTTTPSTTTSAPAARTAGGAVLAGVTVAPSDEPEAAPDQLWSFSRFAPNDPFEQNVVEEKPEAAAPPKAEAPKTEPAIGATPGAPGVIAVGSPGVETPQAGQGPRLTDATISVNGKPQQLKLKDAFPKVDKTFVLVGLNGRGAKIGVAGGAFTQSKTILLKPGRPLTLVDTTTGARYVVRLLYAGAGPEQVASFASKSG